MTHGRAWLILLTVCWALAGCGGQDRDITPGNCGDNVIDEEEECDDGEFNSDTIPGACRENCRQAYCGDGVSDGSGFSADSEECDDGNDNDNDACHNDCTSCLGEMGAAAYESGEHPWGLAVGDLDDDGDLDLVAANWGGDSISVYGNNGDGTLAARSDYATGEGQAPYTVALGDFNGDGSLDVAAANWSGNTVTVHMNNGNGTLADAESYALEGGPYSVVAVDVDSDERLDLVVSRQWSNDLVIMLNQGDGVFEEAATLDTVLEPQGLAAGDLDNDGDLDIAVAGFGADGVAVHVNNGDGTLSPMVPYPAGNHPRAVAIGDVDGDGLNDLAVANGGVSNTVTIHMNTGNANFGDGNTSYLAGELPIGVALGDLDGDGDVDLAVASCYADSAAVMLNRGNGTFGGAAQYTGNQQPRAVAMGDMDNDGDLDLAVTNSDSNEVVVLLSDCL